MIEVIDKGNRWVVKRGNETIIVYKEKNVAVYGKNGKAKCMGYGKGLRKYFNGKITNETFDKMVDYIRDNAFLW